MQALAAVDGDRSATRAAALGALVREDLPALDAALLELPTSFGAGQFQPDANIGPEALFCFEAEFVPARLLRETDGPTWPGRRSGGRAG